MFSRRSMIALATLLGLAGCQHDPHATRATPLAKDDRWARVDAPMRKSKSDVDSSPLLVYFNVPMLSGEGVQLGDSALLAGNTAVTVSVVSIDNGEPLRARNRFAWSDETLELPAVLPGEAQLRPVTAAHLYDTPDAGYAASIRQQFYALGEPSATPIATASAEDD